MITPEYSPYHGSSQKRVFDRMSSGVLGKIALPIEMLAICYLKHTLDDGSSYFDQDRGSLRINKLRTMHQGNDAPGAGSRTNSRVPNSSVYFIRDMRIDELPQLRLVAQGMMSFVGFRPMPDANVEKVRDMVSAPDFDQWLWARSGPVKPGITGQAQLEAVSAPTLTPDTFQSIVEADIRYAREASLVKDIAISVQTPPAVCAQAARRIFRGIA